MPKRNEHFCLYVGTVKCQMNHDDYDGEIKLHDRYWRFRKRNGKESTSIIGNLDKKIDNSLTKEQKKELEKLRARLFKNDTDLVLLFISGQGTESK